MILLTDQAPDETYFTPMDRHFADFMVELAGELPAARKSSLWLASALVSNFVGKGHVCVNLSEVASKPLIADSDDAMSSLVCPEIEKWVGDLRGLPVTGKPGDFSPLVLDEEYRLYLYRYWLYERQLGGSILDMAKQRRPEVDQKLLVDGLKRFFPDNGKTTNWQCIAAALAALNRFTVISGGPGTGKTYTVGRILALLIEQARGGNIAVALAAPTGKAAARLTDMVRAIKEELDCSPEIKKFIPEKAVTIHRLLGPVYGAKTFRYNASNRLPFDVVVVDEASMIDLPLMAKLTTSLKENGRLILLGDKDQLASVEPGAVFGDICDARYVNTYSHSLASLISELVSHELPHREAQDNVLADSIVVLQKSFRFGPHSGIGVLASTVNQGKPTDALDLLKGPNHEDICWHRVPSAERLEGMIEEHYLPLYGEYLLSKSPEDAFSLFNRFHLLCALRHGPYGAIEVNRLIEHACSRRGLIKGGDRWYTCRPVMVTSNDYQLKLFNGDVGILFPDPEAGGGIKVYFRVEGGGFRKLLPGRLKNYETVYAMTIHKSQGSEFDRVAIILPDRQSEVLTRELLYTAVTRAKKSVEIWGREEIFSEAMTRTVQRQSGLKGMLYT